MRSTAPGRRVELGLPVGQRLGQAVDQHLDLADAERRARAEAADLDAETLRELRSFWTKTPGTRSSGSSSSPSAGRPGSRAVDDAHCRRHVARVASAGGSRSRPSSSRTGASVPASPSSARASRALSMLATSTASPTTTFRRHRSTRPEDMHRAARVAPGAPGLPRLEDLDRRRPAAAARTAGRVLRAGSVNRSAISRLSFPRSRGGRWPAVLGAACQPRAGQVHEIDLTAAPREGRADRRPGDGGLGLQWHGARTDAADPSRRHAARALPRTSCRSRPPSTGTACASRTRWTACRG